MWTKKIKKKNLALETTVNPFMLSKKKTSWTLATRGRYASAYIENSKVA